MNNKFSAGKILGVISVKGGVGKTVTVANIGTAFVNDFNREVLLVDANTDAPNLSLHFGFADSKLTLHDVLEGKASVSDAVHFHLSSGVHIIPASLSGSSVDLSGLKRKIRKLSNKYHIIMDSSPSINNGLLPVVNAADELLIVSNSDFSSLGAVIKTARLARELRTPVTGIVLNRVRGRKYELCTKDFEDVVGVPVVSIIPEDEKVMKSVYKGMPVVLYNPNSHAAREFKKLAALLIGEEYKDTFWMRFRRRFFK